MEVNLRLFNPQSLETTPAAAFRVASLCGGKGANARFEVVSFQSELTSLFEDQVSSFFSLSFAKRLFFQTIFISFMCYIANYF